jgi:ankyrin repeat protein
MSSGSGLLDDFAKAIEEGDSTQVETLISSGSIDLNARLPRHRNPPPLLCAVRCNARRIDIIEKLLNAGADIDGADDGGWTACHSAVRDVDLMALLLSHRPNLEMKENRRKHTPLELSISSPDNRVSLMLINAGASLDGGVWGSLGAWASKSTAAIQALLNRGVAVGQYRSKTNVTPLHSNAMQHPWCAERQAAANMLINVCGIDVNTRTVDGKTCLHIAAGHDAIRFFLDAGADVNVVDRKGQTPLHRVYRYECAVLLMAAGANVNARDLNGRIAPMARYMGVDCLDLLLPAFVAAGADLSDVPEERIDAVSIHDIESARRDLAKTTLGFVRGRAVEVCIALQSLSLDALQMCEILQHACGPAARFIMFHHWWQIATTVKHFHQHATVD